MTKYDSKERIPTVSLYNNLKDIMKQLSKKFQLLYPILSKDQCQMFTTYIDIQKFYKYGKIGG